MNEAKIMDWIDPTVDGEPLRCDWVAEYGKDGSVTIKLSPKCIEKAYNKTPIKHKTVDGPENRLEDLHKDLDHWICTAHKMGSVDGPELKGGTK